jgi:hypothetical protein
MALAQHPDPFNGKPFSYVSVDKGFALSSNLRDDKGPITLGVGGS